MTVTIPTSEAQYGYVVGRVIRAVGDTTDADDKPDAVAATGKVTFTPKATLGRTTDYSAFIVREKLDAPLDAQGNLVRYEGATPAGISLTVGAYRVDFTLSSGSIPGFDIEVTAAHTEAAPLDLVTAAPYVPPSGVTVNTMLVPADAVVGQVLSWSASGLDWVDMAAAAGGVSSVAGRTGAVVLSSADLTDVASLATDAELTSGLAGKANSSHTHAPADITGTAVITTDPRLSDARTPTAHTHAPADITGTAVVTTDPRLSDARTPTAHAHPIADVTGLQGALDGKQAAGSYAAATHIHAAADITSGTIAAGRLPTASATASGIVELATTAEATAGTDTTRAVTPAGVKAALDARPAGGTDTEAVQDIVGAMVVGAGGTYNDAAGTIALPTGGGGSDPWTYYVASAETTNDTTTHVNAAGLSIPSGLTAGTYLIDAFVVSKLSADGGHNYSLTKPTGGDLATLARGGRSLAEVWHYANPTAGGSIGVGPNAHPNAAWGGPGAEFKATLHVASGATSTAIAITFAPSAAGTVMTIMRGSYIAIRRIA